MIRSVIPYWRGRRRKTKIPSVSLCLCGDKIFLLSLINHAVKPILKIGFLVASVLLFASVTAAYQLTIAWDANTEPDLEGYILYTNQWSPCPPYDYIATYPVTALADPLNPKCTVTQLDKNVTYYFVVTAYDTEGYESDFSNIISSKGNSVNCTSSRSSSGGPGG